MQTKGTVLGIVGSPNRDGLTHRMVKAALEGAAGAGARIELIQLSDHVVSACRDCQPWVCAESGKCSFKDEAFEFLEHRIQNCGGLVIGTPIYWWDTSGMVRYLFLKMFRVLARRAPMKGLPAFGIGVAGGTGNGLVTGLRPLYGFFQVMHMRALEPLPVTRFNLPEAEERALALGAELAQSSDRRLPFASLEERLLHFDSLPFLRLDRLAERRLLAGYVVSSLGGEAARGLVPILDESDRLDAEGRKQEAAILVSEAYDAAVKVFEAIKP